MKIPAYSGKKISLVILVFVVSIGSTKQARASGDDGCSSTWRLVHRSYGGCTNMAFLSPSNDTRVNLLLMMADLRSARPTPTLQTSTSSRPDAPLFLWEQLAYRLGSQADRAKLRNSDAGTQSGPSSPPAMADPFMVAVQEDHALQPEERDALLAARRSNRATDAAANGIANAEKVAKTASAKSYVLYLRGAAAFWHTDYEQAAAIFSSLTNAQPAWVRETATYMVGRTLINRAQVGAFDEYGSFHQKWRADAGTINAAEGALDTYLQHYPKGTYAQSARGLKRRGYWLEKDTGKLEEEYGALILISPDERNISDVELAQEIDNKLASPLDTQPEAASKDGPLNGTQNPFLLAMFDLQAMRSSLAEDVGTVPDSNQASAFTLSTLQKQQPYFASQMPLYEYLLAVHAFYIENKPVEVLRMIPDAARRNSFSYLQFSRQVLRGLALEAVKDHNALGFWMQMLPGAAAAYEHPALELAIAYHEERAGEIREVFAPASPVHYPYLREVLLANVADAGLLRMQATNAGASQRERDIALFTLLFKEATRGRAADFLKDVALVPSNAPTQGYYMLDDIEDIYSVPDEDQHRAEVPLGIFLHDQTDAHFGCHGLRASEEQLVKDANEPTAQLCVADFVRLNPSVTYLVSSQIKPDELGGTPSLFPGGPFVRMDTYTAVLANAKSSEDDKAYALFRAVHCYASSGNNGCGGKDVPKSQRKAWFMALKRDYAGTRWANALQYYW